MTITINRKPANLCNIIERVRRWGEYSTRRYYYTTRTTGDGQHLQLVRIVRSAFGTTRILDPDEIQVVAILY